MRRSYKLLVRVRLLHSYYTNGIAQDFTVVPVPETVRWLKDNNMLFRNDDTGFRIFYTADTGSTLLEPFTSFEAERLRFMLILNDPGRFFNITDLTIEGHPYKPGNILEFVNKGVNLDFDKQLILKSEPQVFTYQFPQQSGASSDIGKLEVFNERGEQVAIGNSDPEIHYPNPDEILPDANNNFVYPMDLTGYPTGIYRFKSYVNNTNEQERSIYMDGQLQKMNVFAMIHIDLKASSILFGTEYTAPDYKALFSAKSPYWRYLLIMKNRSIDGKTYAVVDEEGEYTFIRNADTEINGIQTLVYDSDQVIPLSEQPITSLSLVDLSGESSKGIKVVEFLSNPVVNSITDLSPSRPDITQIYVYV